MANNPARAARISNYDILWGSYPLGFVDTVTPALKVITKPYTVGSLGKVKIGEIIVGLEGSVKAEGREVDAAALKGLVAWATTAGNASPGTAAVSLPLIPAAFHADMYSYAQTLVLHPNGLASGDTSMDMTLLKAVPLINLGARDGDKFDIVTVEWSFYPDRSLLVGSPPTLGYGWIGPAPS